MLSKHMSTSWHENVVRITGTLWGIQSRRHLILFSWGFFQVMSSHDAFVIKHVSGKPRLYLAHSQPFVSVIFMTVSDTNITSDVVLLCSAVNDVAILWKVYYSNPFHGFISGAIPFKLSLGECHTTPINGMTTLVLVMAWYRQTASDYLSQ